MKLHPLRFLFGLLAAAAISSSVQAGIITKPFISDAEFNSIASEIGFTKVAGATSRIGNNSSSGDWELAIVQPNDSPFSGK